MFKSLPKGVLHVISLEMFDRFIYYGLQAILVLYVARSLDLNTSDSYNFFGIYAALGFIMPLIGGLINDRFLSTPISLLLGCAFFFLGCVLLAFFDLQYVYLALSATLMGVGLIKSNSASLVGKLYEANKTSKEHGFTLYYLGMNVGAIVGPLLFGFVAYHFEWHQSALFAFVLMALLFVLYLRSFRYCTTLTLSASFFSIKRFAIAIILLLVLFVGIAALFFHANYFDDVIWIAGVITLVGLVSYGIKLEVKARRKLVFFLVLNFFSMFYMASCLQISSSVLVYIQQFVHRDIFGLLLPAPAFLSLYSFFILFLVPLMAPLFSRMLKQKKNSYFVNRVALGLLFTMLGFSVMTLMTKLTLWNGMNLPLYCIVLSNILLGLGELCIVPLMISAPSSLLPRGVESTFIGVYFLFNAFAAYFASVLAKRSSEGWSHVAEISPGAYTMFFAEITLLMFLGAIGLWLLKPWLSKL
jgi:POT family proton-dependent oligopeptide transporter